MSMEFKENRKNMTNKPDEIEIKPTKEFSSGPLPEEMIATNQFRGMNWFMMLIVAMVMISWLFEGEQIFGFDITGWSWVIPEALAVIICLVNINRIVFPVGLWLPWVGLLLLYWFFGRENPDADQNLLQKLSPLAVGCAVSIFRPDNLQLETVIRWISRFAWIAWILLFIRVPMIITGTLPNYGFMTAEMIGLLLFGACYASFYACGSGRHLYYYIAMLGITVTSLTRGPIVAMITCLPLTSAPLTTRKRILFCVTMIICAVIIFNTDRVQQRTFLSGHGSIADLRWDNPDFQKSGRTTFLDVLWPNVEEHFVWGNGFNSYRSAFNEAGLERSLPHNDWLKLLHDMGIVGVGLYLITMVVQMLFLIRIARWSSGAHQMLAYGVATAFIPYALIMLTDNVVLYVQFFGNLHFALIGMIYGTMHNYEETYNA